MSTRSPLASGDTPFTFLMAPVTSFTGIVADVVNSDTPAFTYPLVSVADPVPPFATGTTPVNLLALTLMILASVIDASAIAVVAIAAST